MVFDKIDDPIKYLAEKHGLTIKQVEDGFKAQFAFARHVISKCVDKEKEYFPTIFYQNFLTFHFNKKKWELTKLKKQYAAVRRKNDIERIHNKLKKDEATGHTEE
jgi:hypothetical protein